MKEGGVWALTQARCRPSAGPVRCATAHRPSGMQWAGRRFQRRRLMTLKGRGGAKVWRRRVGVGGRVGW
ncbi:hypothetical protein chiPu_0023240 [Chiloscyllium punctatum]|uniref:Uncharacterized protein n=1 Tax=Chiloscyllium punctatum TaxID=137246 RepID=A0A401T871_CHIPU|nr:hypothetical protein [Chiloscyllium punctatum]